MSTTERHRAAPGAAEVLGRYPGPARTLPELLRSRAAVAGGQPAVEFEQRGWSYAQLAQGSQALARSLAAWGVQPGDRVAHVALNSYIGVSSFSVQ